MKYTKLGSTGLDVSRLCLGGMSFGEPGRGADTWTLPEKESREIVRAALEHGVTFFDTANVYSAGSGEEILGRALRDHARRDEVVVATKVFGPMREGPNSGGLSRKAILTEAEHSLRRLGTDYIDLYQIHRWDPATPVEETLAALDALVTSGKVRYVGASSMFAWQFAKALFTAGAHGWARFVSMQDHYNLLNREEEREMLPLCADQGVGVLPWSPLARGRLARPAPAATPRTGDDAFGDSLYEGTEAADQRVVDAVASVSRARGVPMAAVALAWLLRRPAVTAPVIGVTRPEHLHDALLAVDLELTEEEAGALEEPYVPHRVAGFE
ncbi:aldo/keto reductase [Streptomyces sp. MS19]|uniref:aldo/keto reductase n=1 Tax=unclassified Streptomyces TaxID=2593676 RepID=UPI0037B2AF98